MVRIPAGKFVMGVAEDQRASGYDGRPAHMVHVPSFEIGKFKVTQEEISLYFQSSRYWQRGEAGSFRYSGNDMWTMLNWLETHEYINWLNSWTDGGYRLPSEAEWEYACRAGTTTRWWFGDDEGNLDRYVLRDNHRVGQTPANSFGLHEMCSEPWEWCEDPWHPSYEGAPDNASVWVAGGNPNVRVIRGGHFGFIDAPTGSAVRHGITPIAPLVSFRLARSNLMAVC
jgi:formylglycine-generating enzyme required for sulfatase activity